MTDTSNPGRYDASTMRLMNDDDDDGGFNNRRITWDTQGAMLVGTSGKLQHGDRTLLKRFTIIRTNVPAASHSRAL